MLDLILDEEQYMPTIVSDESESYYQYPRKVRIDENPPLETLGAPSVLPGDLVVWRVARGADPSYYSPRQGRKACGIVLETRWSIVDWSSSKSYYYAPEAAVMWSDGQATSSHHSTLRRISPGSKSKR